KDGSSDPCSNHTVPTDPAGQVLLPGQLTGSPVLNPNPQFQSFDAAGNVKGQDVVKQNAACSARFNDVLTIGARVGWAAGHWMPCRAGGYARGVSDSRGRTPPPPAPTATGLVEAPPARLGGWFLGGGLGWPIPPGWPAGIEYRHYDFGSHRVTAFNTTGA